MILSMESQNVLSPLECFLIRLEEPFLIVFFSYWTPDTIFQLKCLNYRLEHVVLYYTRLVWDIDTFFEQWFPFGPDFRQRLAISDAVVSGSQVLQFFDRSSYPETALDIFTRIHGAIAMGQWLLTIGYEYMVEDTDDPDPDPEFMNDILALGYDMYHVENPSPIFGTFRFVASATAAAHDELKVKLIVVRDPPITHILNFHSSTSNPVHVLVRCTDSFFSGGHELYNVEYRNIPISDTNLCAATVLCPQRRHSLTSRNSALGSEIHSARLPGHR